MHCLPVKIGAKWHFSTLHGHFGSGRTALELNTAIRIFFTQMLNENFVIYFILKSHGKTWYVIQKIASIGLAAKLLNPSDKSIELNIFI